MRKLLTALGLAVLELTSCVRRPSMEAPRPARHYYHHRQRQHERARRHTIALAWQKQ